MRKKSAAPLAALALAAGVAFTADAAVFGDAAAQRARDSRGPDYVVAESRWGHGTVSGPVRRGRNGWEVRMPGGTWLEGAARRQHLMRTVLPIFLGATGVAGVALLLALRLLDRLR